MNISTIFALVMTATIPLIAMAKWHLDKPDPNDKNKRVRKQAKSYPTLSQYFVKNTWPLIAGAILMFLFSKCVGGIFDYTPKGEFNEVTGKPYDQYRFLK